MAPSGGVDGGDLVPQDQFRTETVTESGLIAYCHVLLLASKDVFHCRQHFNELDPDFIADCRVLPRGGERF